MLLYNIESMAKKMSIDYQEVTNHIEHMGLRGSSRENILREYIKQLLPQNLQLEMESLQMLMEPKVSNKIFLFMMRSIRLYFYTWNLLV